MTKLQSALKENLILTDALMNLVLAIADIANNPKSDLNECHKHFEHAIRVLDAKEKQNELPN